MGGSKLLVKTYQASPCSRSRNDSLGQDSLRAPTCPGRPLVHFVRARTAGELAVTFGRWALLTKSEQGIAGQADLPPTGIFVHPWAGMFIPAEL